MSAPRVLAEGLHAVSSRCSLLNPAVGGREEALGLPGGGRGDSVFTLKIPPWPPPALLFRSMFLALVLWDCHARAPPLCLTVPSHRPSSLPGSPSSGHSTWLFLLNPHCASLAPVLGNSCFSFRPVPGYCPFLEVSHKPQAGSSPPAQTLEHLARPSIAFIPQMCLQHLLYPSLCSKHGLSAVRERPCLGRLSLSGNSSGFPELHSVPPSLPLVITAPGCAYGRPGTY